MPSFFYRGIFTSSLLITLASVSFNLNAAVDEGHGLVHMGGEIITSACGIASSSLDQTVDFGNFSFADVYKGKAGNNSYHSIPFEIQLVDCVLSAVSNANESYSSANIIFDGQPDNQDPQSLGITGEAKGVAIQLFSSHGAFLPLGTSTGDYKLVEGNNLLKFYARVKINPDNAQAGEFQSLVRFTLSYL